MPTQDFAETEVTRLRALNRLMKETRDSVHPLGILEAVRAHIHAVVPFDRLGLLYAEPKGRYCIVHELVTKRDLPHCPPGSIMQIEGTAIEWVFRELKMHVNLDLSSNNEFLEDEYLYKDGMQSIVRVPLFYEGEAYGIMTVKAVNRFAWNAEELSMLEEVGLHLGSALYISKLVLELTQQSFTDALTGVYNRRALHQIHDIGGLTSFAERMLIDGLEEEVTTLAVLLIDVDDFKQYNDTYGHDEGDRRLVALSKSMRLSVPDHQLIFRYGGDEFVVILPNATEIEAHRVAATIRQSALRTGDHEGHPIALSIGVRHDAWSDFDLLLRAADCAMYEDKKRRQASLEA